MLLEGRDEENTPQFMAGMNEVRGYGEYSLPQCLFRMPGLSRRGGSQVRPDSFLPH